MAELLPWTPGIPPEDGEYYASFDDGHKLLVEKVVIMDGRWYFGQTTWDRAKCLAWMPYHESCPEPYMGGDHDRNGTSAVDP